MHSLPPEAPRADTDDRLTLRAHLRFELRGWIGRKFLCRFPPIVPGGPQLLNLGCGDRQYKEYVNADFYRLRFWSVDRNFWMLDVRYPFRCRENYWDGIFTEHTLEHLYPSQALAALKEMYRTLKPGKWVRVVVPDLAKYVSKYIGSSPDPMFDRWRLPAEAMRHISQRHFHHSLWDARLMKEYLGRAGFTCIEERAFGSGTDLQLIKDTAERKWESLYFEAKKS